MKAKRTVAWMAGIVLAAGSAWAANLDADTDLIDDTVEIPLEGGNQNVKYKAAAVFGSETGGYDFGDRDADGEGVEVTPPGLSMGAFYLRHNPVTSDSRSIRLDLNGGDLTSTGGYISADTQEQAGNIYVQNVEAILMGDGYITARRLMDNNWIGHAGYITITNVTGDIQVASIRSYAEGRNRRAGEIMIHSAGDVRIEDGSGTPGELSSGYLPAGDNAERGAVNKSIRVLHQGNFSAGTVSSPILWNEDFTDSREIVLDGARLDGVPSGSFSVSGIDGQSFSYSSSSSARIHATGLTIRNYTNVTVFGEINTSADSSFSGENNWGDAGAITITNIPGDIRIATLVGRGGNNGAAILIECGGDVLIEDQNAEAGMLANSRVPILGRDGQNNTISVLHRGSFRAASIVSETSRAGSGSVSGKDLLFDGAANGGMPSGVFQVGLIDARGWNSAASANRGIPGAPVLIRGYTSVSVAGDILTRTETVADGDNWGFTGDVTITNITGDITIGGTVDASADRKDDITRRGSVVLQAGGRITLGSLNLTLFENADFDAGGDVEILGVITGDDNESLSGDGTTLNNAGNFYLPTGQTMTYRPEHNPLLDTQVTYTLNGGGTLKAWRPGGTVIRFR